MKISIAMATFNGARFIEEQLASLSGQSAPPAELVVCDDGSSDDTLAIVERFSHTAPFEIRIVRNERQLGVSANFLKAASLCKHDWIAFSDQDDVWNPAKLATIQALVEKRPAVLLVAHRAELVDERLRPLGAFLHVPPARKLTIISRLTRNFWLHPYGFTMAFSGRLVRELPFDARPIHSFDRWIFALATAIGETAYLPQSLALYRRHGTNYSELHPAPPWSAGLLDGKTAEGFAEIAGVFDELSHYFEDCARSTSEATQRDLLLHAAKVYRRMASRSARRAVCCGPNLSGFERARSYLDMLVHGAYASYQNGGLGWRAGVKDAARLFARQTSFLARVVAKRPTSKIT